MSEQRLKEIEEDCKDIAERLTFKEKRIAAYENSREYKKCDDVKEEMTAVKHQHRQLEAEAKRLKKSSSQSRWYFAKNRELEALILGVQYQTRIHRRARLKIQVVLVSQALSLLQALLHN